MILVLDIGNTHTGIGAFEGTQPQATWQITTRPEATPDEYAVLLKSLLRQQHLQDASFSGGAIASSVPSLLSTWSDLCQRFFQFTPLAAGPGLVKGMPIRTDNPSEVGSDRLANALAAKTLYGAPAIVIDFSTAAIFDVVGPEGDYLGTIISPGLSVSAQALFRATAQLARVEWSAPASGRVIGKNSRHSVQSGLVYGYAGLVEGLISRIRRELGCEARVIATGEQAHLIAPHVPLIETVDENLTLQGLRLMYEAAHGN